MMDLNPSNTEATFVQSTHMQRLEHQAMERNEQAKV